MKKILTRKLTLVAGVVGALVLSLGLLVFDVEWWALPILAAILALSVRTTLLVQAGGQTIAAIKRDQRRLRGQKCQHKHPASANIAASDLQHLAEAVSAALAPAAPSGPVRPSEVLTGSSRAEFSVALPDSSSSVELWVQVADFDVLSNEFQVRISVDGRQVSQERLGAHAAGSLAALGSVDVHGARLVTLDVQHSPGTRSALPASGAFGQVVAVVSHPILPAATLVVGPATPREAVDA